MAEDKLDLSELLDDEEPRAEDLDYLVDDGSDEEDSEEFNPPDRIFVHEYEGWSPEGGGVEYIRADAIRAGFTTQIWREACRYAQRTAGQPGGRLREVRDLIEGGR